MFIKTFTCPKVQHYIPINLANISVILAMSNANKIINNQVI